MSEKKKWAFWAFVVGSLLVVCIPSTILISTLQNYVSFLEGFEPGTLKPIKIRLIPHRGKERPAPAQPVRFVSFRLKARGAKKVFLTGDFEAWKPEALPLWRQDRGIWEIILPLPPGSYHYLFLVDGTPTLDPQNKASEETSGRKVSVKTIR